MYHTTDRLAHTMAFVKPVMELSVTIHYTMNGPTMDIHILLSSRLKGCIFMLEHFLVMAVTKLPMSWRTQFQ